MMKFGYARVSSAGQSLATQIAQLKAEKCDVIYSEKFTGTTVHRPQFERLLNRVQTGDTIVVTKLDRFARNTKEALEIIQELLEAQIKIHILNMGIIEDTPSGRLIFTLFSAFAQFERDMIITRTQEGKVNARLTNPDYREGRQLTYTDQEIRDALHLRQNGATFGSISRKTGISVSTLKRRFKLLPS
ncbi:Putative DNA invertase (Plasmidic resolvase) (modular protein) [Latilactobacillus fuchuensis]|uniref:DNA invertase (Plasmidic resolvase) (Modular protein) n=3 Tax=Latilactobacillus fuchuensis TaxID=164393 RepID=A0A2N9DXH9_9LACO|nr:DNA invertase (Plasmidic resolvase) [Latilactobacillus fuchuensis DSM 14340 = JCM 11249]SPC39368.1 Putative DNA invertase (Plasmidic resolvase) (modular protein) [Latilactobacillus fuchuensis]